MSSNVDSKANTAAAVVDSKANTSEDSKESKWLSWMEKMSKTENCKIDNKKQLIETFTLINDFLEKYKNVQYDKLQSNQSIALGTASQMRDEIENTIEWHKYNVADTDVDIQFVMSIFNACKEKLKDIIVDVTICYSSKVNDDSVCYTCKGSTEVNGERCEDCTFDNDDES